MDEKRAGRLQDLVGAAQLSDLAHKVPAALRVVRRRALVRASIDINLPNLLYQQLRKAANRRSYRLDRRPQQPILATLFPDHPNGPLMDTRRDLA